MGIYCCAETYGGVSEVQDLAPAKYLAAMMNGLVEVIIDGKSCSFAAS